MRPRTIGLGMALLGLAALVSAAAGDLRAPEDRLCPRVASASAAPRAANHAVVASWAYRFYRTSVRPARGGRCPMSPSCSRYSQEALAKHGPVVGLCLTADRLMRCGADARCYRTGYTARGFCRLDPAP